MHSLHSFQKHKHKHKHKRACRKVAKSQSRYGYGNGIVVMRGKPGITTPDVDQHMPFLGTSSLRVGIDDQESFSDWNTCPMGKRNAFQCWAHPSIKGSLPFLSASSPQYSSFHVEIYHEFVGPSSLDNDQYSQVPAR
jgi:hypothetical protein